MPLHLKIGAVDVEVKAKPVGNELLVPKPEIKMRTVEGESLEKVRVVASKRYLWIGQGRALACETRFIDPETEKPVQDSEVLEILDHYSYRIIDSKAQVFNEKDEGELIEHYYVDEKGEEHVVRPFERTAVLEVPEENWVPSTTVDQFLINNIYELYTDKKADIVKLWEEAEKRLKEDVVGLTTYSHGRGFTLYYAFLCPVMVNGRFGWLLKLTDTKIALNHLTDIPARVKIPVKEVPTLQALPPVQLIVTTAQRKKKVVQ